MDSIHRGRKVVQAQGPDLPFVRESDLIVEDPSIDLSAMVLLFTVIVGSVTTI